MIKQDIWMPIVIGDYLGDTQRLTTEQHGAYFLLLMDYWRNGPPPADDEVLRSITRLKTARFLKHKSILLSFFTVADGKLHNKRADAEKALAKQNGERNSAKARHAAKARWNGANGEAPRNATSNATRYAPECPSPSPSFPKGKGAGAPFDPAKFIFDEGLSLLVGTGSAEGAARSFLGKCRKVGGDDRLASLIEQAVRQNISDPRAWLQASLAKPPANEGLGAAVIDLQRRKAAQADAA